MDTSTPLTSLLVHADASVHLQPRLRLALELARRHGAALDVLYAVTSGLTRMPHAFGTAMGAGYGVFDADGPLMQTLLKAEADRCKRSQALFDRLRMEEPDEPDEPGEPGHHARTHWHEATGEPVSAMVQAAWGADVLVLGQHDPEDTACGVLPGFVSDVLLATGKPGLVVPYIGANQTPGRRMLVAWKPTPEAARAVTAALPLLCRAERVQLAVWAETDTPHGLAPAPATAGIDKLLRRHGVQAEVLNQGRAGGDLGEHLLSLAADTNADLIVMGCYSKSRARERLLGGVTRTVLQSMTVPVLMSN
jgi:nucleotide-binding universal stress UspA family protein